MGNSGNSIATVELTEYSRWRQGGEELAVTEAALKKTHFQPSQVSPALQKGPCSLGTHGSP